MGRSPAYWRGWLAFQMRQTVPAASTDSESSEWAEGFAAAVREWRKAKAWYRSKTILAAILMSLVGVALLVFGNSAVGGTLTVASVLQVLLRMLTHDSIRFTNDLSDFDPR